MARIICLGDAMVDITVALSDELAIGSDTPGRISFTPGGSAANAAAWLGHLGADVAFVGRIGDDVAGREFVSSLAKTGVKSLVLTSFESTTGSCVCLVDPSGERTMIPDAGANLTLQLKDFEEQLAAGVAHLHISAYPLMRPETGEAARQIIEVARAAGCTISVDPASYAPIRQFGPQRLLAMLGEIDLLLPDEPEALALATTDDVEVAARTLLAHARVVVIKCGAEGVFALSRGGDVVDTRKEPRDAELAVIDTTGAGDAFAAGFLASWVPALDQQGLTNAVHEGERVARICIQLKGGRPPTD